MPFVRTFRLFSVPTPIKPSKSDDAACREPARQAQIFSRFRRDLDNVEIKEYDFSRRERLNREQMHALATLHEGFVCDLGASLSGLLRTAVEVRLASIEQKTWAEFIAAVSDQTTICPIDCPPLDGPMAFALAPRIACPIIDRLLGGASHSPPIPLRALTVIERSLIRLVLKRCTAALTDAWQPVCRIEFSLGAMESNARTSQVASPDSAVAVIHFETIMPGHSGALNLCIPLPTIQPVVDGLTASSGTRDADNDRPDERDWKAMIAQNLSGAMVDVSGVLAETTLTLAELRDLQIGDVITTEKPATAPVTLLAGGSPRFLAEIGQHHGQRALKIARAMKAGERL